MPETIFGLPLHPLIVHATVVVVPLAAILLLASALSPRFRRWAGILTPAAAVAGLILTPLSTSSGENLQGELGGGGSLVHEHAELADFLLPWMVAVTVLALALWWFDRQQRTDAPGWRPSKTVATAVTVLSVLAFLGTTVQVVLIGHSGAKAAWSGVAGTSAASGGGDSDEG